MGEDNYVDYEGLEKLRRATVYLQEHFPGSPYKVYGTYDDVIIFFVMDGRFWCLMAIHYIDGVLSREILPYEPTMDNFMLFISNIHTLLKRYC